MKKRRALLKLAAACAASLALCACGQDRSLGQRAIVKAVYLDESGGAYHAGLAVFLCEPNSDTASVQGEAKIYTGEGASMDEALRDAEQKQNKTPFYAQNELLFLGPGALRRDVTPYLAYFGQENAARPNLSVFAVDLTQREFSRCDDTITDVVREGGRIVQETALGAGPARGIYELAAPQGQRADGWLPVLSFGEDSEDFIGVRELVLLEDGRAGERLEEEAMSTALLLAGKQDTVSFSGSDGGEPLAFTTQPLTLTHSVENTQEGPVLTVRAAGRLRSVSLGAGELHGRQAQQAAHRVCRFLQRTAEALGERTFARGNDVFHHAWWLRQRDAAQVQAMQRAGTLWQPGRVQYVFDLRVQPE